MLRMRKFLSVALVVVMLFGAIAVGASALATGKRVGLVLESDKKASEIVPGAAVTVTLKFEMADFSQLLSDSRICILYDSTVYTPDLTSRTFVGDLANYAKNATQPNINPKFATACMTNSSMSAEDQAKYNSGVLQQILADIHIGAASKAGFSVTEDADGISVAEMTMVFNVTGDADAIAAGNIDIALCDASSSKAQYIKETDGTNTPKVITFGAIDASKASILANMAPVASSIIKDGGSNIRFRGIGSTGTVADYQGEFDVRTVATISEADFKAKFTDDATAIEKITDIGFVYAAKSKVATFDVATAKAVAQGTAAEGYVKAPVNYIQHEADGADYRFTCLIKNIPDADQTDAVSALAYVCFNGEYIFADAAIVADYTELYARMPK